MLLSLKQLNVISIFYAYFGLISAATYRKMGKAGSTKLSSKNEGFPVTLEGFGYRFNDYGQLRSIETGEKFQFEVKHGDKAYNQLHYEALGKVIDVYIYDLLVNQEDLEKVILPIDAVEGEARSFIFMSKEIEKFDEILILIHGSGVVRAGQWTRNLIINHSLERGSQIPYIHEAKKRGYGIVVLNTNQNVDVDTERDVVRGSASPEDHFLYVWDKIIHPKNIKNVAIMAHSYGGVVVVDCAMKRLGEMQKKVFAVAMSDSVHVVRKCDESPMMKSFSIWFRQHGMNWVSSHLPLDANVNSHSPLDSKRVSAGTKSHIETSWMALASVFQFFDEKLNQRIGAISREQRLSGTLQEDVAKKPQSPESEAPQSPSEEASDLPMLVPRDSQNLSANQSCEKNLIEPSVSEVPMNMSQDVGRPASKKASESYDEDMPVAAVETRRLDSKEPIEHDDEAVDSNPPKTEL